MAYDSILLWNDNDGTQSLVYRLLTLNKKSNDPPMVGGFGVQPKDASGFTTIGLSNISMVASPTSDLIIFSNGNGFWHYSDGVWTINTDVALSMPTYQYSYVSDDNIWCVSGVAVFHWNGAVWSVDKSDTRHLWGIHYISDTDVWAVGGVSGDERLWHKTVAGWANIYSDLPGTPGIPRAVWAADASNVYVVTNAKEVFHFDGASTWTLVHTAAGATSAHQKIWGADNSNIWVANTDAIDYYNGSTWVNQDSGFDVDQEVGLNGISSTEVYFCGRYFNGNDGEVRIYDGSSWTLVTGGLADQSFRGLHPYTMPVITADASAPSYNTGSAIGINRIDSDFTINNHKLSPSQVVTSNMSSVDFVPFGFGTKQLHIKTPFPQVVAAAGESFVLKYEDNFNNSVVDIDTTPGNGTITEDSSNLILSCTLVDTRWENSVENAPFAHIDLSLANELSGNIVKIEAKMTSLTYSHTYQWADFKSGLALLNDTANAHSIQLKVDGSSHWYYVSRKATGFLTLTTGPFNTHGSDIFGYDSVPIIWRAYYNNSEADKVIEDIDGNIKLELLDRHLALYMSFDDGDSWSSMYKDIMTVGYEKAGFYAAGDGGNGCRATYDYLKAWAYE